MGEHALPLKTFLFISEAEGLFSASVFFFLTSRIEYRDQSVKCAEVLCLKPETGGRYANPLPCGRDRDARSFHPWHQHDAGERSDFFSRVFIPFAIFAGPVVGLIAAMIYLWKLQRESVPGTYRTMRRWLGWGLMLVNLLTIYPIYYLIASLIS